jgi:hypothetical protein
MLRTKHIIFLLLTAAIASNAEPPVLTVRETDRNQVQSAALRDFLTKTNIELADLPGTAGAAEQKRTLDALTKMVGKLLKPSDGSAAVHLVLIDDQTPNAFFTTLSNGERVIGINTGTLRFVKNDDTVAFILGHEIEHGPSELQAHIERIKKDPSKPFNNLLGEALQRAVENEADIKSTLNRVIPAGYNPYASEDFFHLLEKTFGDKAGSSHTMSSSRRHSVGLALADQVRNRGAKLPEPGHYADIEFRDTRRFLESAQFKAYQLDRIEKVIGNLGDIATPWYEKLAALTDPDAPHETEHSVRYQEWQQRSAHFPRLGWGILSDAEIEEREGRLKQAVTAQFDETRRRFFATGFQPTTPQQWRLAYLLDSHSVFDSRQERLAADPRSADWFKRHPDLWLTTDKFPLYYKMALINSFPPGPRVPWVKRFVNEHLKALNNGPSPAPEIEGTSNAFPKPFASELRNIEGRYRERFLGNSPAAYFTHLLDDLYDQSPTDAVEYLRTLLLGAARGADTRQRFDYLRTVVGISGYHRNTINFVDNGPLILAPALAQRVFGDPDFAREYVQAVTAAYQRVLPTVPAAERGTVTAAYLEKVRPVIDREAEPASISAWTDPLRSFRTKALRDLFPFTDAILPEWKKLGVNRALALHFASHPEIYFEGNFEEVYPRARLLADLAAIAADPAARKIVGRTLPLVYARQLAIRASQAPAFLHRIEPLIDYSGRDIPLHSMDEMVDAHIQFADYLGKNHPEQIDIRQNVLSPSGIADRIVFYTYRNALRDSSQILLEETLRRELRRSDLPVRARTVRAATLALQQAALLYPREETMPQSEKVTHPLRMRLEAAFQETLPKRLADRIEAHLGWEDARQAHPNDIAAVLHDYMSNIVEGGYNERKQPLNRRFRGIPLESLTELLERLLGEEQSKASIPGDKLFEYVWEQTKDRPDLRARLQAPEMVGKLYYQENQKLLAQTQLEANFGLEQQRKAQLSLQNLESRPVRPLVKQVQEHIDKQFPTASGLRDEMLNHVQHRLVTNSRETDLLDSGKMKRGKWTENVALAGADVPHMINAAINNPSDKLILLAYLSGQQNKLPQDFLRRFSEGMGNRSVHSLGQSPDEFLATLKRHFITAHPTARSYVLQPLLDETHGLLAHPQNAEELYRFLLGKHYDNTIVREIFKTYLSSVPASERGAILGYVLGQMGASNQKGASLKSVLEAMGPFGIKAGQFLRASGLVSKELRAELDHFFDKALPPEMSEIVAKLRQVFGLGMDEVISIRPLRGSGSINYVVELDLRNPRTDQSERVVIRVRRDHVVEHAHREGEVLWKKVVDRLRQIGSPESLRWAGIVNEARSHTMHTLQPGGVEVDAAIERGHFASGLAGRAYNHTAAEEKTGFTMEVAQPRPELQHLVPAALQDSVSVYEYVTHTPLKDLPLAQRQGLAEQIMRAELEALFTRGVFDPDGHPGNWLVDTRRRRLVRIDYAQLQTAPPDRLESLRTVLGALIEPKLSKDKLEDVLVDHLSNLFDFRAVPEEKLRAAVRAALRSSRFPSFSLPQERILKLREDLEARLGVETKLADFTRAALSSIARTSIYTEHTGTAPHISALLEKVLPHRDFDDYLRDAKWERGKEIVSDVCRRTLQRLGIRGH